MMFYKRESALSLVPIFVKKAQHWHALKEQKQEKMDELALSLRAFLCRSMLDTLLQRLQDAVKDPKQLKTAMHGSSGLLAEGGEHRSSDSLPAIRSRDEDPGSTHGPSCNPGPGNDREAPGDAEDVPLSARRLEVPLDAETSGSVARKAPQSHSSFRPGIGPRKSRWMTQSAIWQLVGGSLRPERVRRSALAVELAKRLQGPLPQLGRTAPLSISGDLESGHACSHTANVSQGALCRSVGFPSVDTLAY